MIIGITYDLRDDYLAEGYGEEETAEFDSSITIEAIEHALQYSGFKTDRIGHVKALVQRLARGDRWDLVFNIAEGLKGFAREAQVPALLEAYDIPYTFSDPMVLSLALHKGITKRIIRDLGIPTPDFAIIETEDEISRVDLSFPLFAKPVAEGTGKGITAASKIGTKAELDFVCRGLLSQYKQPVLVETFLPGREFTVGIIGTGQESEAVGTLEIVLKQSAEREVYSYVNKEMWEEKVEYRLVQGRITDPCHSSQGKVKNPCHSLKERPSPCPLPLGERGRGDEGPPCSKDAAADEAQEVALAAWRGLGCRDAGRVDLRADSHGHPCFMEVNPLAGLRPKHSDLPILCALVGIKYHEMIDLIMKSALKRVG